MSSARLSQGMLLIAAMALPTACEKKTSPVEPPAAAEGSDPGFDERWKSLASQGVEAVYIEDDKGEGLMGNVRRASDLRPDPAVAETALVAQEPLPEYAAGDAVQRTIRRNLAAVKGCYMSMSRTGVQRSGKAIVSFAISPEGAPTDLKIDAPAFSGTPLPGCVTGQVARWSFPRSQKGGGQVSYPFVFVGG